eukprot:s1826_g11.t4
MLSWLCGAVASAVLICYAVSWIMYWKRRNKGDAVFYGPVDCWIQILTRFPFVVLGSGIVVPAALGFYGLQQCGFNPPINMDFASYLAVDLQIQFTYDCVQETIKGETSKRGNRRRQVSNWSGWHFPQMSDANELGGHVSDTSANTGDTDGRRLSQQQSKPWRSLEVFYEAVDTQAGIFTENALTDILLFEELVQSFRTYNEYCLVEDGQCKGPASPTAFFFEPKPESQDEWTLRDINATLRAMLREGILGFTDKDFNALNLKSGYTRATFRGGCPLNGYTSWKDRWSEQLLKHEEFLRQLFEQVLSRADESGGNKLPFDHVVFTWYEPSLKVYEVNKWLLHDALWCAGTFAAVTILMILNIQSVFLTIFGLLGVLLAFIATFFFHYIVMGYTALTILDFLSLFLIVGIAADDIFIMCHTFYLAPAILGDHSTPEDCMKWAYKQAGEAMLVTTATTAGSFYANCVSVLIVVKQFGFFMGTLVVWNYINVMVILPAALLVLELYIRPCIQCCFLCSGKNYFAGGLEWKSDPDIEDIRLAVIPELEDLEDSKHRGSVDSVGCQSQDGGRAYRTMRNSWRTTITSAVSGQSRISAVKRLSTIADRVQSQLVTNMRTLASRATFQVAIHRDLDLEKLSGIERAMHDRFYPLLLHGRACWLLLSLTLSVVGGWLAVSGFTLAKGDLEIFPESVNVGRLERLRKEVFTSEDLMETDVTSTSVPTVRAMNSPVAGNIGVQCPGINASCSGHGVCNFATRSCSCSSRYVGAGCSLERRNSTFAILPQQLEILKVLEDPSMAVVAEDDIADEQTVWIANDGDDSSTWRARVLPESNEWLKLRMTTGSIGPRDLEGDAPMSSQSQSALSFWVNFAGKSAGWTATADILVSIGNNEVVAEVRSPPAVSIAINLPCPNCYMKPPFSLSSGYPNPTYEVHVPYSARNVSLHLQRFSTEQVWVDGIFSVTDTIVQQLPATGATNVSVQVVDRTVSANYSLEFRREESQPAAALHLHRAVAKDSSIEVTFALPAELPFGFEGIAAFASSTGGLPTIDYAPRPCEPASCWDWSMLNAVAGSCCLMRLVNLTNGMDWTFQVHMVAAGVPGLPSLPTVGHSGGWPPLSVSAIAMSPSLLSAPSVVIHHGFVELLVVESQVHAGGSVPLGLLRCESSPGGLQSSDNDSSYVSSRGEWRTKVRDLDVNLQYSFTCSICNSAEDPPGVGSCSSRSLHTALVRPVVEAPQAPEIMFLEWSFDAPAPTVRIKVQTPYPEEVWCFAAHGNLQMEGYAVVPPGEMAHHVDLLVVLQSKDICYMGSAMNVSVSCKSQICDVGLGGSGCMWGPAQVAEYRRPSPPVISVSAGNNSLWVAAQSDEVGQLELSCDASGGSSAAASQTVNKTEQSAFSPLHLANLGEGVYLISWNVRKMGEAFSLESSTAYHVDSLGPSGQFALSPRVLAVSPVGEGALQIDLALHTGPNTSQDVMHICQDLSGNFSAISATSQVVVRGLVPGWDYSFTCFSYLDGSSEISEASVSTLAARKPDAPSIVAIAPGVERKSDNSELAIFLSLPTSISSRGFAPFTGLTCSTTDFDGSLDLAGVDDDTTLMIRLPGVNGISLEFHCFIESSAGRSTSVLDVATPGLPIVASYRFMSTVFSEQQLRHHFADALGVPVNLLTLNQGHQRQGNSPRLSNNMDWTVQVVVPSDGDPMVPALARKMSSLAVVSKLSTRLQTPVEAMGVRVWSSNDLDSSLRELMIFEIPRQRRFVQLPSPLSGQVLYAQVASKHFSILAIPTSPLASVKLNGSNKSQIFQIRQALPFAENVSVDVVAADGLIRSYLLAVGAAPLSCEGNCGNGSCDEVVGQCVCNSGWTGSNCDDHCPGFPACGGEERGQCIEFAEDTAVAIVARRHCVCNDGFGGDDCGQSRCPKCLNGGTCVEAADLANASSRPTCQCPSNSSGIFCESLLCPGNCSGAGSCDSTSGRCSCWLGATTDSCNVTEAPPEPLTNSVDVLLVWGIKGPRADNKSLPEFDAKFDFFQPQVQSWILDVCHMAKNKTDNLLVRTDVPCWIESWRDYVEAVGGSFPIAQRSLASEALQAFFHQDAAEYFQEDLGMTEDNFGGQPTFVVLRFFVNLPKNDGVSRLQLARNQWGDFVMDINRRAPTAAGEALMVSHAWTKTEMEETILSNTGMSFFLSIGIAVASVLAFSHNLVIGFYVLLTIVLEVCPLFGFLFGVVGFEFGAIEAVGAVIFVGMSVDYCLHMAHGYHVAPRATRRDKMQVTMVNLGPSILGGAFTTAAATVFLLPCRIVLFVKLGTMLVANTILSLLYTYFFLAPLLIVAGPLEDDGSFSWLGKKVFSWLCSSRCRDEYSRQEEGAAVPQLGLATFQDTGSLQLPGRGREARSILRKSSIRARRTQVRFDPADDVKSIVVAVPSEIPFRRSKTETLRISSVQRSSRSSGNSAAARTSLASRKSRTSFIKQKKGAQQKSKSNGERGKSQLPLGKEGTLEQMHET